MGRHAFTISSDYVRGHGEFEDDYVNKLTGLPTSTLILSRRYSLIVGHVNSVTP